MNRLNRTYVVQESSLISGFRRIYLPFSAAVVAITALNRMMALGADQKGFCAYAKFNY